MIRCLASYIISFYEISNLNSWCLMTPYDVRDLDQHCFKQWLVRWRHQTTTVTNSFIPSAWFVSFIQGIAFFNTKDHSDNVFEMRTFAIPATLPELQWINFHDISVFTRFSRRRCGCNCSFALQSILCPYGTTLSLYHHSVSCVLAIKIAHLAVAS